MLDVVFLAAMGIIISANPLDFHVIYCYLKFSPVDITIDYAKYFCYIENLNIKNLAYSKVQN